MVIAYLLYALMHIYYFTLYLAIIYYLSPCVHNIDYHDLSILNFEFL